MKVLAHLTDKSPESVSYLSLLQRNTDRRYRGRLLLCCGLIGWCRSRVITHSRNISWLLLRGNTLQLTAVSLLRRVATVSIRVQCLRTGLQGVTVALLAFIILLTWSRH